LAARAWPAFALRADQEPWLDRIEVDLDNFRSALRWLHDSGDTATALDLAGRLYWFWYVRGYLGEGRTWLERVLAVSGDAPTEARARAILGLAMLAHWQGDDARAVPCLEESLGIWRRLSDQWGIVTSLGMLGVAAEDMGEFDRAVPFLEQALSIARDAHDRSNEALLLDHLGVVTWGQGNLSRAILFWEEGLALHRSLDDHWGASISLSYLGMVACDQGDLAAADAVLRESLTLRWAIGSKEDVAHGLANFAALAAAAGHGQRAARLFGAAEAMQEAIGNPLKEPERTFYARAVERAKSRLEDYAFAAAWTAGRALPWDEAVAEALDHPADAPITDVKTLEPSAGLTQREMEVLQLLVAGYSDRQIGEALFISWRTAQGHVAHVCGKLGVSTRAAVVAFALRSGLVNVDNMPQA
jgi:non-specific serine/threonine protein kinase